MCKEILLLPFILGPCSLEQNLSASGEVIVNFVNFTTNTSIAMAMNQMDTSNAFRIFWFVRNGTEFL